MIENGGFQAAKAEIQWIAARFRGAKFHGCVRPVRGRGEPVEDRAARVAQREQLCDFVVGFACGIIARLSQLAVMKERTGVLSDDAAGEAYDKVAKLLALGYP